MEEQLSQPNDRMFERNVGHIAKRGREVEVWVEGIPEPRVGFIAGLDEGFVQLCLTSNQALSNIRRANIISMDETGNTIGLYARDEILDDDVIHAIREKIGHFQKRASFVYAVKKPEA